MAVSSLGVVEPYSIGAVAEGGWEVLEMALDSGAAETVGSEDMLASVDIQEGEAKKKGVQYEIADGTLIPNLGEMKFVAVTEE